MSDADWYSAQFDPWVPSILSGADDATAPSSSTPAAQPLLPSGVPWGNRPIIFPGPKPDQLPLPSPGSPWWFAPPIFPKTDPRADAEAASASPPPVTQPVRPSGQRWGNRLIIFPSRKPDALPLPPVFPPADPLTAQTSNDAGPSASSGDPASLNPAPSTTDSGPPLGHRGLFSASLPTPDQLAGVGASVGKAISNIPSSAVEFGKGLVQPIIHPVDTLQGFKNLALGLLEKTGITGGTEHEQYADALGQYFLDRYGSLENLQRTFEQDPIGLAGDLEAVFSGGTGLAGRIPGLIERAGKLLEHGGLRDAIKAASAAAEGATATGPFRVVTPDVKYYSVAFETRLKPTSYPGVSRPRHYQEANEALLQAIESDPAFAQALESIGVVLNRTRRGRAPRSPPSGWSWHHAEEPGVMQLVPRVQHKSKSFARTLHPGGAGGFSRWGKLKDD
jgi:hypothetical protein